MVKSRLHFFQPGRLGRAWWFAVLAAMNVAAQSSERLVASGEWLIKTWEVEHGLPENSATAMVQTADGYLWFGTFRGLVRFDGIKFTVFNSGNTPQLPSDGIVNLHLDRSGRLWVSTLKGLVVREGQQWHTLGTNEGWVGDYVRTFAERANGDLLLTSFYGQVMEFVNGRLAPLPEPPGEPRHGYFAHADEAGQWWVVQNRFVGRWDGQRWVEVVRLNEPIADAVVGGTAPDGSLLLVLRQELRRYRRGVEVSRVPLEQLGGGIWSVSEDSRGDVWIASFDKGLCRVQPDGRWQLWTTTNGLSYNSTRFVFEDRERNLWVGTSGGGLMRFKERRFQTFSFENGVSERAAKSVWPDVSGGLWIASYGKGLFRLEPTGIRIIPLPNRVSSTIYAQSVLHDRAGRVWVGTLGEGLWLFDSAGARRIPPTTTGGRTISALFEDSRGRVWIGGDQGLAVFESGAFRAVDAGDASRIRGVVSVAEDRDGGLWFSNLAAVFRLGPEGPVELREGVEPLRDIACLKADADGGMWLGSLHAGLRLWHAGRWTSIGPEAGLPVSGVHAILEDRNGVFWLSSNRGIARVRRSELLAVADGKTARVQGQLFDLSDGLPSIDCPSGNQPSCARDPRGRLWFATSKGVAMTDPDNFRLNTNRPPVQIEEVVYRMPAPKAAREPAHDSTVRRSKGSAARDDVEVRLTAPFHQPLHLPPESRQIEIHYTALSFSAPEKVRFQTRLEGTGHDWDEPHDRRFTRYYDWPAGEYTLQVRAANNDGVWNETGASLAFLVQPFFWQTWWFRLLVGVLTVGGVAGTVWGVMRGKLRQHEEHLAHEREIRQAREQLSHLTRVSMLGELSGSLAHELNQPLTAILSNAQAALRFLNAETVDHDELRAILKDIADDDQRAGEVIRRLRALVKRGEVQLQPLDLNDVVRETFRLVHSDLVTRNVALVSELDPDPLPVKADRVQLQQVFLNLILNGCDAMADSAPEERKLTVMTSRTDHGGVQLSVKDCGHGIPVDQLDRIFDPFVSTKSSGLGLGLAISRSIVEAHGGRLQAVNNAEGGASFSFVLPPPKSSPA